MTWREKMKDWGGGDFTFLSTDGEAIVFIVVGEPVLMTSVFKGKEQERIGCPIVTEDGYVLFICGKRVARRLSKLEPLFATSALMVVRHGVEGDVDAKYDVRVLPEPETYTRLVKVRDSDFNEEMIQESIDAAKQVLGK